MNVAFFPKMVLQLAITPFYKVEINLYLIITFNKIVPLELYQVYILYQVSLVE